MFFKSLTLKIPKKVTVSLILLFIEFIGLAVGCSSGSIVCYFNPMIWVFEYTVETFNFLGGFIFPFMLLVSFTITYIIVCILGWIFKKIFNKNSNNQIQ